VSTAPQQEPQEEISEPAPSGRRALQFIERFCALGPRVAGSAGAEKARAMMRAEIEKIGYRAVSERFKLPTSGGEVEFVNLLVEVPGTSKKRIVWAAHYDTPDVLQDIYWQSQFPATAEFVGANDGGSGVAVLLELLRARKAAEKSEVTHVFLFLDGEERIGPPPFRPNLDDPLSNACFGARAQALKWREAKNLPQAFVLLDMVGDRDLQIVQETSYSSPELIKLFVAAAKAAGHGETQFQSERGMMDDHVPFDEAGVACIDLIDWNYGPQDARGKAGAWWHTPHDTPDKLSAESLATTAQICIAAIPALERFALRESF
jgi:glutaminyl-peptide cyclotransferase